MKQTLLPFLSLLLFTISVNAQNYNSPECVRWDPFNEKYLVSNVAGNTNGYILHLDPVSLERVEFANAGLKGPKGMTVVNNIVYVSDVNEVEGYNLETGEHVFHVAVPGSAWLNGITADSDGNLYVGDTDTGIIHKIIPSTQAVSNFVTSGVSGVNGVLYDQPNNRLLACFWKANSPISAIDLATATVTNLLATPYSNLDGIARDNCGNVYFSSWGSNRVYRTNADFTVDPVVFESELNGPADIFFNTATQELCVPNFTSNTVKIVPVFLSCVVPQLQEPADGAENQSSKNLGLSWTSVPHIKSYKIELSLTPVFTEVVLAMASGSPDIIVETLDLNTTYYWRVSATDGGAYSDFSSTFTFKTEVSSNVEEHDLNKELRVFPNPASEKIGLVWDESITRINQIQVLNLTGQVVWQIDLPNHSKSYQYIDIKEWSRGLYLVKCQQDDQGVIVRKVMVN